MCTCVFACVRACVHVCVRVCVRACVCVLYLTHRSLSTDCIRELQPGAMGILDVLQRWGGAGQQRQLCILHDSHLLAVVAGGGELMHQSTYWNNVCMCACVYCNDVHAALWSQHSVELRWSNYLLWDFFNDLFVLYSCWSVHLRQVIFILPPDECVIYQNVGVNN